MPTVGSYGEVSAVISGYSQHRLLSIRKYFGVGMKERLVHEWRDWILRYDGEEYELIQKKDQSSQPISAKNDMDAETQCQLLIKKTGGREMS